MYMIRDPILVEWRTSTIFLKDWRTVMRWNICPYLWDGEAYLFACIYLDVAEELGGRA